MPDPCLQLFDPSYDDLLDWIIPQIDESMLIDIASSNYGIDVQKHLEPLKLFHEKRVIPEFDWHPCVVLELIRWSEPDETDWKPGGTGVRGHLMRAFSCSFLLLIHANHKEVITHDTWNTTASQLLVSLKGFGPDALRPGVRFFAWCVERFSPLDPEGMEVPFLAIALLALAIDSDTVSDAAIVQLCQKIDSDVAAMLMEWRRFATDEADWLLSTNNNDSKNQAWKELGTELHLWGLEQPPSDKATWVGLIGALLSEH